MNIPRAMGAAAASSTSSLRTWPRPAARLLIQHHPQMAMLQPCRQAAVRKSLPSVTAAVPAARHHHPAACCCSCNSQMHAGGSIQHPTSSSFGSRYSSSNAVHRLPGSSIRCDSTPNPQPSNLHPDISWLTEVQVWPSSVALSSSSNGSSNGNGGSNGNGNGTNSSVSNSRTTDAETALVDLADINSKMQFDAIIVLAGGLHPDGTLPAWALRRLDVARDLHMLLDRKPPIVCSGGGTPHKPAVLAPSGHVLHESTSMATYLMANGVQPDAIYKETASYDTVGNTYFGLTCHALPAGWQRLAVVTSHFHMARSRALFSDIYRLAGSSLFGDPFRYHLTFFSASDSGVFDEYVYNARLVKEAGSVAHWKGVAEGLSSLSDFHAWLHSDHLCYAVPRQHEFGKRTIKDQKLLESY